MIARPDDPLEPSRECRVEVYRDQAGKYRWRRIAANGEITSTGESHGSRRDALRAYLTDTEIADSDPKIVYVD